MPAKDLVLRVAVPAMLILYVLPVLAVSVEATRYWTLILHNQNPVAGPLSKQFVMLLHQSNGPLALIQKAMGVLASGALVATLWSEKDRVLDVILIALLATGLLTSLWVWFVFGIPDVSLEVLQAAEIVDLQDAKAFASLRDQYFTGELQTLLSFGAVLIGVQLKK